MKTYPASFIQERLWFLHQLRLNASENVMPWGLRIRGPRVPNLLRDAPGGVVRRHEILPTTLEFDGDVLRQVVHDDSEAEIRLLELRASDRMSAQRRRVSSTNRRRADSTWRRAP